VKGNSGTRFVDARLKVEKLRNEKRKMHQRFCCRNLKDRDHLEDTDVERKTVVDLKEIRGEDMD
jgi:hypothetical protein